MTTGATAGVTVALAPLLDEPLDDPSEPLDDPSEPPVVALECLAGVDFRVLGAFRILVAAVFAIVCALA